MFGCFGQLYYDVFIAKNIYVYMLLEKKNSGRVKRHLIHVQSSFITILNCLHCNANAPLVNSIIYIFVKKKKIKPTPTLTISFVRFHKYI